MGGIFSALHMSLQTLSNMQTGIALVNQNIANVNTPGYSRKRLILEASPGLLTPFGTLGSGAEIDRVQSIRDLFVESRILAEYQAKGFFEGQSFGVQQLESVINTAGNRSISDHLTRFFNSFLQLSNDPSSITLRQAVIAEGQQLIQSIANTTNQIDSLDIANRLRVEDAAATVNGLLYRIAEINGELIPQLNKGLDGGVLYDERQNLINQLSKELEIQVQIDQSHNMVISTRSGRLLLAGSDVTEISVGKTTAGVTIEYLGNDITSEINSGKLGGLLEFQNNTLPSIWSSLNRFSAELVAAVNTAHQNGFDLDGNAGGDIFSVTAGSEARTIALLISDPRAVAAAGPGAGIGDGTNAQALSDVRDQKIVALNDVTLGGFYSQIVFDVGLTAQGIQGNLEMQDGILSQLESQREGVSGVSLDEEAVTLLQLQRIYQSSARLVKVLDSLLEETVNLIQ